ncbi:hypothetical protein DIPPA_23115 [Diplonema papillatum]|nr:hypothetical protein DIPPA_23115 [Diplonema papillatum]KAJ9462664.1 hypothetical protein DIPPA_23115 [Diplonema papillatum]KAJ9462665.1 hypothetical protein DIPPA_23115 [Diplonema papillatum]
MTYWGTSYAPPQPETLKRTTEVTREHLAYLVTTDKRGHDDVSRAVRAVLRSFEDEIRKNGLERLYTSHAAGMKEPNKEFYESLAGLSAGLKACSGSLTKMKDKHSAKPGSYRALVVLMACFDMVAELMVKPESPEESTTMTVEEQFADEIYRDLGDTERSIVAGVMGLADTELTEDNLSQLLPLRSRGQSEGKSAVAIKQWLKRVPYGTQGCLAYRRLLELLGFLKEQRLVWAVQLEEVIDDFKDHRRGAELILYLAHPQSKAPLPDGTSPPGTTAIAAPKETEYTPKALEKATADSLLYRTVDSVPPDNLWDVLSNPELPGRAEEESQAASQPGYELEGTWVYGQSSFTITRVDGRLIWAEETYAHGLLQGDVQPARSEGLPPAPVSFPARWSAWLSNGGAIFIRTVGQHALETLYRADPERGGNRTVSTRLMESTRRTVVSLCARGLHAVLQTAPTAAGLVSVQKVLEYIPQVKETLLKHLEDELPVAGCHPHALVPLLQMQSNDVTGPNGFIRRQSTRRPCENLVALVFEVLETRLPLAPQDALSVMKEVAASEHGAGDPAGLLLSVASVSRNDFDGTWDWMCGYKNKDYPSAFVIMGHRIVCTHPELGGAAVSNVEYFADGVEFQLVIRSDGNNYWGGASAPTANNAELAPDQILGVGDRVRVRDSSSHDWKLGIVTEVADLAFPDSATKVRTDGWQVAYTWTFVEKILAPPPTEAAASGTNGSWTTRAVVQLYYGDRGVIHGYWKAGYYGSGYSMFKRSADPAYGVSRGVYGCGPAAFEVIAAPLQEWVARWDPRGCSARIFSHAAALVERVVTGGNFTEDKLLKHLFRWVIDRIVSQHFRFIAELDAWIFGKNSLASLSKDRREAAEIILEHYYSKRTVEWSSPPIPLAKAKALCKVYGKKAKAFYEKAVAARDLLQVNINTKCISRSQVMEMERHRAILHANEVTMDTSALLEAIGRELRGVELTSVMLRELVDRWGVTGADDFLQKLEETVRLRDLAPLSVVEALHEKVRDKLGTALQIENAATSPLLRAHFVHCTGGSVPVDDFQRRFEEVSTHISTLHLDIPCSEAVAFLDPEEGNYPEGRREQEKRLLSYFGVQPDVVDALIHGALPLRFGVAGLGAFRKLAAEPPSASLRLHATFFDAAQDALLLRLNADEVPLRDCAAVLGDLRRASAGCKPRVLKLVAIVLQCGALVDFVRRHPETQDTGLSNVLANARDKQHADFQTFLEACTYINPFVAASALHAEMVEKQASGADEEDTVLLRPVTHCSSFFHQLNDAFAGGDDNSSLNMLEELLLATSERDRLDALEALVASKTTSTDALVDQCRGIRRAAVEIYLPPSGTPSLACTTGEEALNLAQYKDVVYRATLLRVSHETLGEFVTKAKEVLRAYLAACSLFDEGHLEFRGRRVVFGHDDAAKVQSMLQSIRGQWVLSSLGPAGPAGSASLLADAIRRHPALGAVSSAELVRLALLLRKAEPFDAARFGVLGRRFPCKARPLVKSRCEKDARVVWDEVFLSKTRVNEVPLSVARAPRQPKEFTPELKQSEAKLMWGARHESIRLTDEDTVASRDATQLRFTPLCIAPRSMRSGRHEWNIELIDGNVCHIGVCSPDVDLSGATDYTKRWTITNEGKLWGAGKAVGQVSGFKPGSIVNFVLDADSGVLCISVNGKPQPTKLNVRTPVVPCACFGQPSMSIRIRPPVPKKPQFSSIRVQGTGVLNGVYAPQLPVFERDDGFVLCPANNGWAVYESATTGAKMVLESKEGHKQSMLPQQMSDWLRADGELDVSVRIRCEGERGGGWTASPAVEKEVGFDNHGAAIIFDNATALPAPSVQSLPVPESALSGADSDSECDMPDLFDDAMGPVELGAAFSVVKNHLIVLSVQPMHLGSSAGLQRNFKIVDVIAKGDKATASSAPLSAPALLESLRDACGSCQPFSVKLRSAAAWEDCSPGLVAAGSAVSCPGAGEANGNGHPVELTGKPAIAFAPVAAHEWKVKISGDVFGARIGAALPSIDPAVPPYHEANKDKAWWLLRTGELHHDNETMRSSGGTTCFKSGDVVTVTQRNKRLRFAVNGAWCAESFDVAGIVFPVVFLPSPSCRAELCVPDTDTTLPSPQAWARSHKFDSTEATIGPRLADECQSRFAFDVHYIEHDRSASSDIERYIGFMSTHAELNTSSPGDVDSTVHGLALCGNTGELLDAEGNVLRRGACLKFQSGDTVRMVLDSDGADPSISLVINSNTVLRLSELDDLNADVDLSDASDDSHDSSSGSAALRISAILRPPLAPWACVPTGARLQLFIDSAKREETVSGSGEKLRVTSAASAASGVYVRRQPQYLREDRRFSLFYWDQRWNVGDPTDAVFLQSEVCLAPDISGRGLLWFETGSPLTAPEYVRVVCRGPAAGVYERVPELVASRPAYRSLRDAGLLLSWRPATNNWVIAGSADQQKLALLCSVGDGSPLPLPTHARAWALTDGKTWWHAVDARVDQIPEGEAVYAGKDSRVFFANEWDDEQIPSGGGVTYGTEVGRSARPSPSACVFADVAVDGQQMTQATDPLGQDELAGWHVVKGASGGVRLRSAGLQCSMSQWAVTQGELLDWQAWETQEGARAAVHTAARSVLDNVAQFLSSLSRPSHCLPAPAAARGIGCASRYGPLAERTIESNIVDVSRLNPADRLTFGLSLFEPATLRAHHVLQCTLSTPVEDVHNFIVRYKNMTSGRLLVTNVQLLPPEPLNEVRTAAAEAGSEKELIALVTGGSSTDESIASVDYRSCDAQWRRWACTRAARLKKFETVTYYDQPSGEGKSYAIQSLHVRPHLEAHPSSAVTILDITAATTPKDVCLLLLDPFRSVSGILLVHVSHDAQLETANNILDSLVFLGKLSSPCGLAAVVPASGWHMVVELQEPVDSPVQNVAIPHHMFNVLSIDGIAGRGVLVPFRLSEVPHADEALAFLDKHTAGLTDLPPIEQLMMLCRGVPPPDTEPIALEWGYGGTAADAVGILPAQDSTDVRPLPARSLWRAARYVAKHFKRFSSTFAYTDHDGAGVKEVRNLVAESMRYGVFQYLQPHVANIFHLRVSDDPVPTMMLLQGTVPPAIERARLAVRGAIQQHMMRDVRGAHAALGGTVDLVDLEEKPLYALVEVLATEMQVVEKDTAALLAEKRYVLIPDFLQKMVQLSEHIELQDPAILQGPSGTGKSCCVSLLAALEQLSRRHGFSGLEGGLVEFIRSGPVRDCFPDGNSDHAGDVHNVLWDAVNREDFQNVFDVLDVVSDMAAETAVKALDAIRKALLDLVGPLLLDPKTHPEVSQKLYETDDIMMATMTLQAGVDETTDRSEAVKSYRVCLKGVIHALSRIGRASMTMTVIACAEECVLNEVSPAIVDDPRLAQILKKNHVLSALLDWARDVPSRCGERAADVAELLKAFIRAQLAANPLLIARKALNDVLSSPEDSRRNPAEAAGLPRGFFSFGSDDALPAHDSTAACDAAADSLQQETLQFLVTQYVECRKAVNFKSVLMSFDMTPASLFGELAPLLRAAVACPSVRFIVFIDEMNASSMMGTLKRIIVDRYWDLWGAALPEARGRLPDNVAIVCAVNPHKKDVALEGGEAPPGAAEKQPVATAGDNRAEAPASGTSSSSPPPVPDHAQPEVRFTDTVADDELGFDVQALPPPTRDHVIPWKQLSDEQRDVFCARMLGGNKLLFAHHVPRSQIDALVGSMLTAHKHVQNHLVQCKSRSTVSQRDIHRTMKLFDFFFQQNQDFITGSNGSRAASTVWNRALTAILCSIAVSYYFRLQPNAREDLSQTITSYLKTTGARQVRVDDLDQGFHIPDDFDFLVVTRRAVDFYCDAAWMKLPDAVFQHQGLLENLFVQLVCFHLRLGVILHGAPGTSKTLSNNIIRDNMTGRGDFMGKFAQISEVCRYQGSNQSTADEIKRKCVEALESQQRHDAVGRKNKRSLLFVDEAGLVASGEKARKWGLKVLHYYLESGLAAVLMTNDPLDPAISNRCVEVYLAKPSEKELTDICCGILHPKGALALQDEAKVIVPACCVAFGRLLQGGSTAVKERRRPPAELKWWYGLRDLFHLMRFLRRQQAAAEEVTITASQLMRGLERNFNGLPEQFAVVVDTFGEALSEAGLPAYGAEALRKLARRKLEVVSESLADNNRAAGTSARNLNDMWARFKLLVDTTVDGCLLELLHGTRVHDFDQVQVLSLSSLSADELMPVTVVSQIAAAMETGKTVWLTNTRAIDGCLFDVFNQNYQCCTNGRNQILHFVALAVGAALEYKRVHRNFQAIVHVTKVELSPDVLPAPFLNRLEKFTVGVEDVLEHATHQLPEADRQLAAWAREKCGRFVRHLSISDRCLFSSRPSDTLDSAVLAAIASGTICCAAPDDRLTNRPEVAAFLLGGGSLQTPSPDPAAVLWRNRACALLPLMRPEGMLTSQGVLQKAPAYLDAYFRGLSPWSLRRFVRHLGGRCSAGGGPGGGWLRAVVYSPNNVDFSAVLKTEACAKVVSLEAMAKAERGAEDLQEEVYRFAEAPALSVLLLVVEPQYLGLPVVREVRRLLEAPPEHTVLSGRKAVVILQSFAPDRFASSCTPLFATGWQQEYIDAAADVTGSNLLSYVTPEVSGESTAPAEVTWAETELALGDALADVDAVQQTGYPTPAVDNDPAAALYDLRQPFATRVDCAKDLLRRCPVLMQTIVDLHRAYTPDSWQRMKMAQEVISRGDASHSLAALLKAEQAKVACHLMSLAVRLLLTDRIATALLTGAGPGAPAPAAIPRDIDQVLSQSLLLHFSGLSFEQILGWKVNNLPPLVIGPSPPSLPGSIVLSEQLAVPPTADDPARAAAALGAAHARGPLGQVVGIVHAQDRLVVGFFADSLRNRVRHPDAAVEAALVAVVYRIATARHAVVFGEAAKLTVWSIRALCAVEGPKLDQAVLALLPVATAGLLGRAPQLSDSRALQLDDASVPELSDSRAPQLGDSRAPPLSGGSAGASQLNGGRVPQLGDRCAPLLSDAATAEVAACLGTDACMRRLAAFSAGLLTATFRGCAASPPDLRAWAGAVASLRRGNQHLPAGFAALSAAAAAFCFAAEPLPAAAADAWASFLAESRALSQVASCGNRTPMPEQCDIAGNAGEKDHPEAGSLSFGALAKAVAATPGGLAVLPRVLGEVGGRCCGAGGGVDFLLAAAGSAQVGRAAAARAVRCAVAHAERRGAAAALREKIYAEAAGAGGQPAAPAPEPGVRFTPPGPARALREKNAVVDRHVFDQFPVGTLPRVLGEVGGRCCGAEGGVDFLLAAAGSAQVGRAAAARAVRCAAAALCEKIYAEAAGAGGQPAAPAPEPSVRFTPPGPARALREKHAGHVFDQFPVGTLPRVLGEVGGRCCGAEGGVDFLLAAAGSAQVGRAAAARAVRCAAAALREKIYAEAAGAGGQPAAPAPEPGVRFTPPGPARALREKHAGGLPFWEGKLYTAVYDVHLDACSDLPAADVARRYHAREEASSGRPADACYDAAAAAAELRAFLKALGAAHAAAAAGGGGEAAGSGDAGVARLAALALRQEGWTAPADGVEPVGLDVWHWANIRTVLAEVKERAGCKNLLRLLAAEKQAASSSLLSVAAGDVLAHCCNNADPLSTRAADLPFVYNPDDPLHDSFYDFRLCLAKAHAERSVIPVRTAVARMREKRVAPQDMRLVALFCAAREHLGRHACHAAAEAVATDPEVAAALQLGAKQRELLWVFLDCRRFGRACPEPCGLADADGPVHRGYADSWTEAICTALAVSAALPNTALHTLGFDIDALMGTYILGDASRSVVAHGGAYKFDCVTQTDEDGQLTSYARGNQTMCTGACYVLWMVQFGLLAWQAVLWPASYKVMWGCMFSGDLKMRVHGYQKHLSDHQLLVANMTERSQTYFTHLGMKAGLNADEACRAVAHFCYSLATDARAAAAKEAGPEDPPAPAPSRLPPATDDEPASGQRPTEGGPFARIFANPQPADAAPRRLPPGPAAAAPPAPAAAGGEARSSHPLLKPTYASREDAMVAERFVEAWWKQTVSASRVLLAPPKAEMSRVLVDTDEWIVHQQPEDLPGLASVSSTITALPPDAMPLLHMLSRESKRLRILPSLVKYMSWLTEQLNRGLSGRIAPGEAAMPVKAALRLCCPADEAPAFEGHWAAFRGLWNQYLKEVGPIGYQCGDRGEITFEIGDDAPLSLFLTLAEVDCPLPMHQNIMGNALASLTRIYNDCQEITTLHTTVTMSEIDPLALHPLQPDMTLQPVPDFLEVCRSYYLGGTRGTIRVDNEKVEKELAFKCGVLIPRLRTHMPAMFKFRSLEDSSDKDNGALVEACERLLDEQDGTLSERLSEEQTRQLKAACEGFSEEDVKEAVVSVSRLFGKGEQPSAQATLTSELDRRQRSESDKRHKRVGQALGCVGLPPVAASQATAVLSFFLTKLKDKDWTMAGFPEELRQPIDASLRAAMHSGIADLCLSRPAAEVLEGIEELVGTLKNATGYLSGRVAADGTAGLLDVLSSDFLMDADDPFDRLFAAVRCAQTAPLAKWLEAEAAGVRAACAAGAELLWVETADAAFVAGAGPKTVVAVHQQPPGRGSVLLCDASLAIQTATGCFAHPDLKVGARVVEVDGKAVNCAADVVAGLEKAKERPRFTVSVRAAIAEPGLDRQKDGRTAKPVLSQAAKDWGMLREVMLEAENTVAAAAAVAIGSDPPAELFEKPKEAPAEQRVDPTVPQASQPSNV